MKYSSLCGQVHCNGYDNFELSPVFQRYGRDHRAVNCETQVLRSSTVFGSCEPPNAKLVVFNGVAGLESRLGIRLFERTTRTLSLTDAGAIFYRTCVQMLSALEDAEAVFADGDVQLAGRIRIDVPTVFGRRAVLPIILQFVADHPHVHPEISFSDRFVDLIDEGIDILVRIGGAEAQPAAIGNKNLGTERLIFCAAPAYLQEFGVPTSIDDLDSPRCLKYGKADGSASPWRVKSHDVKPYNGESPKV